MWYQLGACHGLLKFGLQPVGGTSQGLLWRAVGGTCSVSLWLEPSELKLKLDHHRIKQLN